MPSTEPTCVIADSSLIALAIPKSASLTDAVVGAQQVARLDVAVHDAVAVGVVEARAGLRRRSSSASSDGEPALARAGSRRPTGRWMYSMTM